ncbi:hypothetical protein [Curtobacterium sp. Curtsp57]|uniref:hypothetical protein n=1 Tax=Curtobacterium sp. Curtsp57 TaxID=3243047 RepID=UPI0039B36C0C
MTSTDARVSVWRATPAIAGLVIGGVWILVFIAANAYYAPINDAYQAHLNTLNNPPILQDPPPDLARAEFVLGFAAAIAVPTAITAIATGITTAQLSGRIGVRVLGWVTFGIGAAGALPALAIGFFGALVCILDAEVLLG